MLRNTILRNLTVCFLALIGSQLTANKTTYGAEFFCASGDVTCLVAAINEANSIPGEDTINLEAGTYTLVAVNNNVEGPTGLPSITSNITINGASADATIIERDPSLTAEFRIFHVNTAGTLLVNKLTIRGGRIELLDLDGGGIANRGDLSINNSVVSNNGVRSGGGGGISNVGGTLAITNSVISRNVAIRTGGPPAPNGGGIVSFGGTVTITESTIAKNRVLEGYGGGISSTGVMTIINSTISDNQVEGFGGGIANFGMMTIMSSTIAGNLLGIGFDGSGIYNHGSLAITNSTISENSGGLRGSIRGGGIFHVSTGSVELNNTILALNATGLGVRDVEGPDCFGPITSLGTNLIGDLTGCTINLQSTDLTGDPGLGAFVDDGAPGNGRFPLLATSRAVNAGSDSACPTTDQLNTPRRGPCDIGAIEFYPVVNDLVVLMDVSTAFDPTPMLSGPAGTFRITAEFINTSSQAIVNSFAEVVELTGGNLLLNANGGAGGVGARLLSSNGSGKPLEPGASSTFEFLLGLQHQEPFTFLVNMLGEPQTSNFSISMR